MICALCCAIGLQWVALQSIAWTAMIVNYSKHGTLCEAIAQTFDGAHPCSLCHIVNKGKTTEKKSDLQLLTPKIDMICTKRAITVVRPFAYVDYVAARFFSSRNRGISAGSTAKELLQRLTEPVGNASLLNCAVRVHGSQSASHANPVSKRHPSRAFLATKQGVLK